MFDNLLEKFFNYVRETNVEIYNEFSLQFELAFFIKKLYKNSKVELERNINILNVSNNKFLKKEMDILATIHNKKFLIELKCIIDQKNARPVTVYDWIKDIKFIKEIKKEKNIIGYSIFVTNNKNLYTDTGRKTGKLLKDFRKREIVGKYYKNQSNKNAKDCIKINEKIIFNWKKINTEIKYFIVKIE